MKKMFDDYYQALIENGIFEDAARTRKSILNKAYRLGGYTDVSSFNKAVVNSLELSNMLIRIHQKVSTQKEFDKVKNAISTYASLILGKSIIGKKRSIKKAIKGYVDATKLFDEIGDFLTSNIVGEYAEIIVCEKYGLKRNSANTKHFDAEFSDADQKKLVQIKSRWKRIDNVKSIEFGAIKNFSEPSLIFVGIIFDSELNVSEMIVMDNEGLTRYFKDHKPDGVITFNSSFDKAKYCIQYLNGIHVDKELFDKIS